MSNMVKLADLCIKITDGSHSSPNSQENGYPMLSVKDMRENGFSYNDCKYISKEDYKKMCDSGCKPEINDILIAKDGSYLKHVFVITEEKEQAILSSIGILKPDVSKVNPYYIKYYLSSDFVKNEVAKKYVSGSALPRIILKNFANIEIPYVSLDKQNEIVKILKSIDDKIENNNKINAELEAMARTIYDYWFLQFEFPNEEGKPYKSSGGKMVWNEELKREIPEGWKVSDLSKYIDVIRGVAYDTDDVVSEYQEGYIPLLKSNNLQNNRLLLDDIIYVKKDNVSADQILDNNSIFVTMSSGSTEHVGKTAVIFYDMPYTYGAFCSKIVIKPKYRGFISLFFLSDYFKKKIRTIVVGTSIKNINNSHLTNNIMAFPNDDILKRFEAFIEPIFNKQGEIIKENQELSSLRDFLLPLLMNGQVGFKEEALAEVE